MPTTTGLKKGQETQQRHKRERRKFALTAIARLKNGFTTQEATRACLDEQIKRGNRYDLPAHAFPVTIGNLLTEFVNDGLLWRELREVVIYPRRDTDPWREHGVRVRAYMYFFVGEDCQPTKNGQLRFPS